LGTGREGRRSESVANFVFGEVLPVLRELGLATNAPLAETCP